MNLLASLRYLVSLQEHRHFGRAAQACHITQPALSNALRALEEEFGAVIVKRGRTFAGFTPEGDRVLASARVMLRERELLQQELDSQSGRPQARSRSARCPRRCRWRRASRPRCSAAPGPAARGAVHELARDRGGAG